MSDPRPEGDQIDAINKILTWYKDYRNNVRGTKQYFYLAGYAGSGKTFLAKHFLKQANLDQSNVKLMTFMARSALVLSNATGIPASTIHSNIYEKFTQPDGREVWILKSDTDLREKKLLIIDECSTVGTKMINDLLSFGRPLLILGDPGQLPPIGDDPFFQKITPDVFLHTIRRQALDNPIIRASMVAREGNEEIPYGNFGKLVKARQHELSSEVFLGTDALITWRRQDRTDFNQYYREYLGFAQKSPYPVVGDKLICRKNLYNMGLCNGTIGVATKDSYRGPADQYFIGVEFKPDGQDTPVKIDNAIVSRFAPNFDFRGQPVADPDWVLKSRSSVPMEYAYALTCHLALGSQFNTVIVQDGPWIRDRNLWLYTAITRAVDQLYIIGNN